MKATTEKSGLGKFLQITGQVGIGQNRIEQNRIEQNRIEQNRIEQNRMAGGEKNNKRLNSFNNENYLVIQEFELID